MTAIQHSGLVELAFYGEIALGHAPEEARRKLTAALGIPPERVDAVFSGRRVVLKKSVPADEAPRYLAKLESIGILARSEPEAAPEPPASETAPPAPPAHEEAPPAQPGDVTCPKCGTRQPKRTLCAACATDMPRYAAAQAKIKAEERAASLAALKASTPAAAQAGDDGIEYAVEGAGLIGTGFAGRIGRLAYFVGGAIVGTAGIFAFLLAFKTSVWLLVPLLVAITFLSLRMAVLRCHDIDWSGWWSLLFLVPYAGSLFSLILLFLPGTRGANDFGRPSRPPGMMALAASLLVFVLALLLGLSQLARLGPMLGAFGMPGLEAAGEPFTGIEDYDPENNVVVMYSLTTCGYCAQKRRELNEMGIRYTELFLDEDADAQAQLEARLDEARLPRQSYGTPIFDVNGIVLPNNPPMAQIVRHLRGRDG